LSAAQTAAGLAFVAPVGVCDQRGKRRSFFVGRSRAHSHLIYNGGDRIKYCDPAVIRDRRTQERVGRDGSRVSDTTGKIMPVRRQNGTRCNGQPVAYRSGRVRRIDLPPANIYRTVCDVIEFDEFITGSTNTTRPKLADNYTVGYECRRGCPGVDAEPTRRNYSR
jgi:hypothetical protein